jgi:aryl-alcohol dehydrogenase-like predicted oxidoreductase
MEHRYLGASGFKVPVLGFGTGTFGGQGPLFSAWGRTDVEQARRLIDLCLEAGVTLFDSADAYSNGAAEEILGAALRGRREQAIVSTKIALRVGNGPNDAGTSRDHLTRGIDRALRRLQTDYIDLLQLHAFDAFTPIEEVLATLDVAVRAGKVRYVGVSNFSGWQLMKSLAIAERHGYPRYVANQAYYSLAGRDYEWELMPLALDQNIGTIVWSPLGWGRLTGRIRRDRPLPATSRLHETARFGPPIDAERLYTLVDVLDEVAREVSSVLLGARDEQQLRENLGAIGWTLTAAQIAKLDATSAVVPPYPYYPYWNGQFAERNPPPVPARVDPNRSPMR